MLKYNNSICGNECACLCLAEEFSRYGVVPVRHLVQYMAASTPLAPLGGACHVDSGVRVRMDCTGNYRVRFFYLAIHMYPVTNEHSVPQVDHVPVQPS